MVRPQHDAPRVSVLMPVFDAEPYVAAAIKTILSQTFESFEFLIVDDGSTDRSPEILEEFAKGDPRVRVVRRPHSGLVPTLNHGLELARGELVARMDADDVALPSRLALQLARLQREESLLCVGGAFEVIDARGRLVDRRAPPCEHTEIVEWALAGRSPISHSAATYRRDRVLALGGYDETAELVEDLDLWLRLAEVGTLANLPQVVSRVRFHAASASEANEARQRDQTRRVCERAWRRRGLPGRPADIAPWRPGRDRRSRQEFAIGTARDAWRLGERRTALVYALRAVGIAPFGEPIRRGLRRAMARLFARQSWSR